jgi:multidrug efflux pump subunit AcrB
VISDSQSSTTIEFRMEVPTDRAVQDVKDAIDRIRPDLPTDIEAPTVARLDVAGQAVLTFAATAPGMSMEELSWFIDDVVKRGLQGKPGIGNVERYGGADREIRITLNPQRLDSYGVTAEAVSQQLSATNINLGAGRSELGSGEQVIRTMGNAASVADLAQSSIALPSGHHVRLQDLGTIRDGYQELRSFSRFNGEQVVTFAVFRAKGASEVSVAELTRRVLARISAEHPEVAITAVDDNVAFTYGNYEAALDTLIEGAILAVLVVFAFLRNGRATLIAAMALPLSAIPTFWVMELLGFSLNLVSFLAITLATGILVDDAIVEVENISRHIRMGKSPYRAAIEAADEIGLAVIATSLTIVAVFAPVSFMPGIPGQFFRQFGLTVAVSVLFSLLVARLITPMTAAYFLRSKDADTDGAQDGRLMQRYLTLITRSLQHPYRTLAIGLVLLLLSLLVMTRLPGSLMPPEDTGRIAIAVELPPGVALAETDATTEAMRRAIIDLPGVRDVFVLGGASPDGQMDIHRATLTVLLSPRDDRLAQRLARILTEIPLIGDKITPPVTLGRNIAQSEIEAQIFRRLAAIPDQRAYRVNEQNRQDITLNLLSDNATDLHEASARLSAAMRRDPHFANVTVQSALPRPEIQITPRSELAARLGVTTAQIAAMLRVATIGDFDASLAKLLIGNRLVPVRVQLEAAARNDIARLGALRLGTSAGTSLPLATVADLRISEGPSTIDRLNRIRRATIGANLPEDMALGPAKTALWQIVGKMDLPGSVSVRESGDAEVQAELMTSFRDAMVLGLGLVLTVLILLFGSVIQPFTILLSLPLAIGGVVLALLATGDPVSMPVLIGILMLMGIVTKNAILLVDFAIEMRAQGMDRVTALIEAGHKRARPIIMTSIAMAAGMLPSALGLGAGGSFRAPMAAAVTGGVIVSTLLSLVIVPAFYLVMDDLADLLKRRLGRLIAARDEPN